MSGTHRVLVLEVVKQYLDIIRVRDTVWFDCRWTSASAKRADAWRVAWGRAWISTSVVDWPELSSIKAIPSLKASELPSIVVSKFSLNKIKGNRALSSWPTACRPRAVCLSSCCHSSPLALTRGSKSATVSSKTSCLRETEVFATCVLSDSIDCSYSYSIRQY